MSNEELKSELDFNYLRVFLRDNISECSFVGDCLVTFSALPFVGMCVNNPHRFLEKFRVIQALCCGKHSMLLYEELFTSNKLLQTLPLFEQQYDHIKLN